MRRIITSAVFLTIAIVTTLPVHSQEKAVPFIQRGAGATSRDTVDKMRDLINVRDFGAKCDGGATDDRAAIQAAIDAAGSGTVYIPYPGCGVSAPGIYLYPQNGGMVLTGSGGVPPGAYKPGAGSGLVAYRANPPAVLLTNYAQFVTVRDLFLDGNGGVSRTGFVTVMGIDSVWMNVTSRRFSGDGAEADNYATPVVKIVAGGQPGSSSVTVASITNNRLKFGEFYCAVVQFSPGTADNEQFAVKSVSGNVIQLSGQLKKQHDAIQCSGNNDKASFSHYMAIANGGWGWRVIPGSDNNGFRWDNGSMAANALGGELWHGSVHVHTGGNYEGDHGPAIQLGEPGDNSLTSGMVIGALGDLEETKAEFDGVSAVCDNMSQVEVREISDLRIQTGSDACPLYAAQGSTTVGFGTDNNKQFFVKTAFGVIGLQPGGPATGGGTIRFYDKAGAVENTLGISGATGALAATTSVTDYRHAQLEANSGPPGQGGKLDVGYNSTTASGFLQATDRDGQPSLLLLNPNGGPVLVGPAGGGVANALPRTCMNNEIRYITDASQPVFGAVASGTGTPHPGGYRMVQCNGNNQWVF